MTWTGHTRRVHSSDTEVQILGKDGVLDGGDVVPGFRLPVRELFA
ncbi:MAG: hypothetical protein V3U11_11650 [Planctomycetota bacterium]